MGQGLENFVGSVSDFESLPRSSQIDFFAYFLLIENKNDGFTPKDILECFDLLHLTVYSNIPAYLTSKSVGSKSKFLKKKSKYYLERKFKMSLDKQIGPKILPSKVQSDFFPIELFDNTRGYLQQIANQALESYNKGIYDGCSVLSRKLIEILIIECFERHRCENLIKGSNGTFFFLSDLVAEFLKEPAWNIGRSVKKGLPEIKKLGDLSAHNRRYIARKSDLDKIKGDFRIVIEELIHLIDYSNWR